MKRVFVAILLISLSLLVVGCLDVYTNSGPGPRHFGVGVLGVPVLEGDAGGFVDVGGPSSIGTIETRGFVGGRWVNSYERVGGHRHR